MNGQSDAAELFAQAANVYRDSDVWHRYQTRRAQKAFPIIVIARNGRCPRCGLRLSMIDTRKLNRGEPVLDACQHILLVGV